MKRLILILYLIVTLPTMVSAQEIALGERIPDYHIKYRKWVNDHIPEVRDFTYIGFVHSSSQPCLKGVEHIEELIGQDERFRILLLTREKDKFTVKWLINYASDRFGVATNCGYAFHVFGVSYAPFGVIVNKKNKALWFGNPATLTQEDIIEITSNTNRKCRSQK